MEKDHLEILLEDMNGKFDLVLEGHAVLAEKIDRLARDTDERFKFVDLKFDALNDKIDMVEARLNDKIDMVEARLNDKIDTVEARLNKRIDAVETSLSERIDAVAADLRAHRADTEAHHGIYRVKE